MSRYRLTPKGKRTITGIFLMIASGTVLAIYYRMGLIYASVGIFTASAIGVLFELYLGLRSMMRRNGLKERMQQTLEMDHQEAVVEQDDVVQQVEVLPQVDEQEEIEELPEIEQVVEEVPERIQEAKIEEIEEPDETIMIQPEEVVEDIVEDKFEEPEEQEVEVSKSMLEALEKEVLQSFEEVSEVPVYKPFGNMETELDSSVDRIEHEEPEVQQEPEDVKPEVEEEPVGVSYKRLSELIRKVDHSTFDWLHDLQLSGEEGQSNDLDYLLITERGLFILHDMENYQVISGNAETPRWSCYRTQEDYFNRHVSFLSNPLIGLEKAMDAVKQILFEFDLLLPVFGVFVVGDGCEVQVSDRGALQAVEVNKLLEYIYQKNEIADINDEMIGILKEVFVIKDEITRQDQGEE